jgi:thiol:disulfide interchange protein DsbC
MKIKQNIMSLNVAVGLSLSVTAMAIVADEAKIREKVSHLLPNMTLEKVVMSPIDGLYEVTVGTRIFYVSTDGRYLIQGNMLDLNTRQDLTEAKQSQAKKAALDKISESKMIVFAPDKPKYTITVFTDIDCGYCRKLHQEIDSYLKEGIKVRYLMFPRAGVGSPSYDKAISVWCAVDKKQALTDAKAGKEIQSRKCDNPIDEHMKLGELMGVTGTPSIILDNGHLLPGYVPAERMSTYLNSNKK